MQFPSHASGDVAFGPDGYLYASAGDGASFDTEDWGQAGNPCGDPANEGGSLRSQDIRTSGDPLEHQRRDLPDEQGQRRRAQRLDQQRGPDRDRRPAQPVAADVPARHQRAVVGDVGGSIWEEINRTDMSSFTGPVNLGWPCYEGSLTGSRAPAGLGRAQQAHLREPVRRRARRRQCGRRTSATAPAAAGC